MKILVVSVTLLASSLCSPAVPDPPKGAVGARKFASNIHDCNGAVAFSGAGALAPTNENNGLLGFRNSLIDKSVGWSRESGEFTCYCPGLYQFTFSGSGKTAEARYDILFISHLGAIHYVRLPREGGGWKNLYTVSPNLATIITGHGKLKSYYYRFEIVDSPL